MGIETGTLLLLAGGAAAGVGASALLNKGGGVDVPKVTAQTPKKTAAKADQSSEAARLARLKRASFVTRGFDKPQLGSPGLVGVNEGV